MLFRSVLFFAVYLSTFISESFPLPEPHLGSPSSCRAHGAGLPLHGQALLQPRPVPARRAVVRGGLRAGGARGKRHHHPGPGQRLPGHGHQGGETRGLSQGQGGGERESFV